MPYINTETQQYPLYLGDIKLLFPNTSFPRDWTPEAPFSPVQPTDYPQVDHTKNVTEGTPVLQDGQWVQVWNVTDASVEEVAQRTEAQANQVRAERNAKLSESDWTQVADAPVDKQAWADYRQALRDITSQAGFPWNVTWPEQP